MPQLQQDQARKNLKRLLDSMNQVILGKEKETKEVVLAILAGGHVLLEDIPGVGKTTLALTLAKLLNLDFRRMQFTPDVLPSDLTGFSIYRRDKEEFVYQQGAVFTNLLLADELNRASARTQSALLEVMQEGNVTVEGITRQVPSPFIVIATENPYGSAGTVRLPESETDRFMISLSMGYPDKDSEMTLIRGEIDAREKIAKLEPVLTTEELALMRQEVKQIYIKDSIVEYMAELIRKTRTAGDLRLGASPRASLALAAMARASAYLDGRDFVAPSDAADQFCYVVQHRISLTEESDAEGMTPERVAGKILEDTEKPGIGR
ncbi:MAG: MoxR family ATPase [Firmicutes bacterium]|nr:MoxR family ATPase [Bacillota bacterium]